MKAFQNSLFLQRCLLTISLYSRPPSLLANLNIGGANTAIAANKDDAKAEEQRQCKLQHSNCEARSEAHETRTGFDSCCQGEHGGNGGDDGDVVTQAEGGKEERCCWRRAKEGQEHSNEADVDCCYLLRTDEQNSRHQIEKFRQLISDVGRLSTSAVVFQ